MASQTWPHCENACRQLAQRTDLFHDVSALLPENVRHFAPAARGMLRDDVERPLPSEQGLGLRLHRSFVLRHPAQDFVWGQFRGGVWRSELVPSAIQMGPEDPVGGSGLTDSFSSLYSKSERFADYLLVNGPLPVLGFDAPAKPKVSDHRPLILNFERATFAF